MRVFLLLMAVTAVAMIPSPPADGCAIPWRENEPVRVDSEDALIIWDAATQTEHFIRRARFQTDAKDFGFMVPTPTEPELAEADDSIFSTLVDLTKPRIEYRTQIVKMRRDTKAASARMEPGSAMRNSVEVLQAKQVAGFDAVVLKANDPKALRDWLETNGYDARKELVEWFRWYTDHNWIITAFKLTKDGSRGQQLMGRTVRMTFKADKPFYPYREPADMRPENPGFGNRLLKVFFLSESRYEGTLGESGTWPGQPVWANTTPEHVAKAVFSHIGLDDAKQSEELKKKWHLTEFEDKSFPRPGTDEIYFKKSADQSMLERPPIVRVNYQYEYTDEPEPSRLAAEGYAFPILIGVLALVVGVICLLGWLLTRK